MPDKSAPILILMVVLILIWLSNSGRLLEIKRLVRGLERPTPGVASADPQTSDPLGSSNAAIASIEALMRQGQGGTI